MSVIIILLTAGIVGWLGSLIMRTDAAQGIVANIVLGGLGSILGRFGHQFIVGEQPETQLSQFLLSLLGTLIVIFIWSRFRR